MLKIENFVIYKHPDPQNGEKSNFDIIAHTDF